MSGGETLVAPLDGWAMPLSAVPDPVFAGGMMGDGIAIDPTGETLHAPCAARVVGIHAAGHAITLRTDGGAELLLHVGIDTVALGGAGFRSLVAMGEAVVAGQPLIAFDLDRIVCGATAAVTPMLVVAGGGFSVESLAREGRVAVGDPLLRLVAAGDVPVAVAATEGEDIRRSVTVGLPHGLHARPAARIAAAVRDRAASATLTCDLQQSDASSMTGLLGLGATCGSAVTIVASGRDAAAVVDAIAAILTATSEGEATPAPPRPPARTGALLPGALAGVAAAPGLAIGTTVWLSAAPPAIPDAPGAPAEERRALATGLARLRESLDGAGGVLAAHRAMLDDPALLAAFATAVDAGAGAAAAAIAVTQAQARTLAGSADARIAERGADLIDIGQRLAHAILGTAPETVELPAGSVLLADDILPSQLAAIPPGRLAGIALVGGGPTAHVAIMAAGLGVPMVVALGQGIAAVPAGRSVILDGDNAVFEPSPDAARLHAARERIARAAADAAQARALAASGRPAATRDGRAIGVHVNLGTVAEAVAGVSDGAEGCGLLRTELLFLDRTTPPSRAEQAEAYRALAAALAGRPLTVRLLDIGGDKPAPYLTMPHEENPALGRRGVRLLLSEPDLLADQLGAILDASAAGACRIMVPMVASADEMVAVRAALDRIRGDRVVALGAMIETPAAAIAADLIAQASDFLSIGSNDLTQYTLAMDRGNAALAASIDALHPAVLRLIEATCEGAARHGVPVSVCGGLAADPLAVPLLIGLGVTGLSVPASRVAATRAIVGACDIAAAKAHAAAATAAASPQLVRDLARAFAERTAA